jgi:hypothetical protein
MKVHDSNGFSTDPEFVLKRWKEDFNSLYNPQRRDLIMMKDFIMMLRNKR